MERLLQAVVMKALANLLGDHLYSTAAPPNAVTAFQNLIGASGASVQNLDGDDYTNIHAFPNAHKNSYPEYNTLSDIYPHTHFYVYNHTYSHSHVYAKYYTHAHRHTGTPRQGQRPGKLPLWPRLRLSL